jgi:hypothetical protein
MPSEDASQSNNNRVTTAEFYRALLDIKDEIAQMERRLVEKIDCIPDRNELNNIKDDVTDLKKRSNTWDGLNSLGIVVGTVIGALFGHK